MARLHTRGDLDRHGHGYGSLSFLTFLSLGDESSPPPECGDQVNSLGCGSAEGEHKGLYARSEKLDLEQAISNGFGLPDQLIQSLFGKQAQAEAHLSSTLSLVPRQAGTTKHRREC